MQEKYKVYRDGCSNADDITANSAKEAASIYYEDLVMSGIVRIDEYGSERIIVEHPRGPEVDKSVHWHTEDGDTFTLFDLSVTGIDVSATSA